jgi:hypothetical protein
MNFRVLSVIRLILVFGLLGLAGCSKPPTPPAPLPVEQIPTEMQAAFAKASPELKAKVNDILQALQSKDYPAAYQGVNSIYGMAGVTEAQRALGARVIMTLNGLMQAAQAQGDQNSGAMLDYIKKSK